MPIALLVVGLLIVVAGIKNNAAELESTIVGDFSGAGSFWYWIVAVIVIGAVGYYQPAKTVSHLFLGLIVLVFLISNNGVFAQIQSAIEHPTPAKAPTAPTSTDTKTSSSSSKSSGSSPIDQVASASKTITGIIGAVDPASGSTLGQMSDDILGAVKGLGGLF